MVCMDFIKETEIINTKYGDLKGLEFSNIRKFLGIPFAKPPVGELTFKHPQKLEKWDGVYEAFRGKKNPIQGSGILNAGNNDLDCLYLNIFAPNVDNNHKLPVLVWIFGGSFKSGGTGEIDEETHELKYDATKLAIDTNSIVVTFNYRLSVYGFLNLNSLDKKFDSNNGLYDQIEALTFIKENISSFGGDENNITLIGQSAGAASIVALLSIEKAKNLFDKAIIMSPVINHFFSYKEGTKIAKKYLKYVNVKENELDKLFKLDPDLVREANGKLKMYVLKKGDNRCAFSPIVDNKLLLDFPKNLAIKSDKTIFIGNVINESNLFIFDLPPFLLPILAKFMGFSFKNKKGTLKEKCYQGLTECIYKKPIMNLLNNYEGKGYKYEYQYVSPSCKEKGIDTFHAADVPVLFGFNTYYENVDDSETIEAAKSLRSIFKKFIYDEFNEFEEWKVNKKEIIIK